MKSRIAPNTFLYQIEVRDFKHRHPRPIDLYVDKSGKGIKEMIDIELSPIRTLFRYAKNIKKAIRSASKKGSVISCHKVDSHMRRLEMITHLRVDQKPIEVDISIEDFTIGRDLVIEPTSKNERVDV